MGELKRGERLQIMLTDDELKALDDWRFAARMPSRAAAIRELLKRGLTAEGFPLEARSKSLGIDQVLRPPYLANHLRDAFAALRTPPATVRIPVMKLAG